MWDRTAFGGLRLGYTETFGAPALRTEIARGYDKVQPDQLLCFAGAEEAIYVAMRVLLDPATMRSCLRPTTRRPRRCRSTGAR